MRVFTKINLPVSCRVTWLNGGLQGAACLQIHDAAKDGDYDRLQQLLAGGCPVDTFDEKGMNPLAYACQSPRASLGILQLLVNSGANPNRADLTDSRRPIGMAAAAGSISKVQFLMDAGADIRYESNRKYTIIVHCIYGLYDSDKLIPMIQFLHEKSASLDTESEYGESPLSVASRFGRFDAVKCLMERGADKSVLGWNALIEALIFGSNEEFQWELDRTTTIHQRDRCGRSVWHLAAFGPYLEKAKLLYERGVDINAPAACGGSTALMLCAERGSIEMLRWLISIGADIEKVDESGATALMAATRSSQVDCVGILLEADANPRHEDKYGDKAISEASHAKIIRMLEDAGEDISELSTKAKRQLLGLKEQDRIDCTDEDFEAACNPRFGLSNPERMNVPFWEAMIRSGCNAYRASFQFDPDEKKSSPIWCFDRFGMSFTKLPDGRFVQIGGEHEDYYDPDFYIYNDVIVHDTNGKFKIYGYPKNVFPPTDFHSATLVDEFIYIIGGLGYAGTRRYGETPVYRLSIKDWSMHVVPSRGDNPGWIYQHRCRVLDEARLLVSGGEICQKKKGKETHEENTSEYELDLRSREWTWKS